MIETDDSLEGTEVGKHYVLFRVTIIISEEESNISFNQFSNCAGINLLS